MMIVQIIFEQPVRYSTDGFSMSQYEPGEFYEVPDHVARGMHDRRWARIISKQDLMKMQDEVDKAAEKARAEAAQEEVKDETPDEGEDTNRRPKKRR